MDILIQYNDKELRELIIKDLKEKLGGMKFEERDVTIEVKSKQNYKSEWESASYRATYRKIT